MAAAAAVAVVATAVVAAAAVAAVATAAAAVAVAAVAAAATRICLLIQIQPPREPKQFGSRGFLFLATGVPVWKRGTISCVPQGPSY